MKALRFLPLIALLLCSLGVYAGEYESTRTFTAGEAISAGLRVKLSGTNVVKAGAGELDIGTVMTDVEINKPVGVKLARTGTVIMISAKDIAAGVAVYGAAAGQISDAVSGYRLGYALTTVAEGGKEVEVIRVPFTATTTGDVTLDAGANLAAAAGAGAVDFSTMTGTFKTPTGAATLSGTTNIAANKNLTCSAGTTAVDLSAGTGTFKTPTGAATLNGDTTLAAGKNLAAAAGAGAVDLSAMTGTFKTPTGAVTLSGNTTVAAGKTIGVTDGGSTAIAAGVGSVKMTTANPADNTVWIPIKYNGTTYYVPGWTAHNP